MDIKELRERQAWPLEQKIDHSLGVIEQFVSRLGKDNVYVSFSGGKDSTVLLDLCRIIYPDIKAVFCNTGNEYPDIVYFVRDKIKNGENIEIIQPKIKPKDVLAKYGFPLVSKEQSRCVRDIRTTKSQKLRNYRLNGDNGRKAGTLSKKWKYLIEEPYMTSHYCCHKLKKEPFRNYDRDNNVSPILGIMADESMQRTTAYINNGSCNMFREGNGKSMPLSIWLEKDIWDYIKMRKLPIAEIYYKGAKRTGCMFCGYGCQFKNDNRLKLVYDMYPKMYSLFMSYTNNWVTYREALRKVLSVNGLYLPDERPTELFKDSDFD
jgi:3'-phosphoadenosine 5'-phosphosulfate sulfotransferase (PAPS reductase)/FAD synthetase